MRIHHRHRRSGTQTPQVGPYLTTLLPVLIVTTAEFERCGVCVDSDLEGLVEQNVAKVRRCCHL